ncbi:winged helix-turn-helix transcriptional regulator [Aeromicrobium sp. CFBP 8757]|uniref:MarR family winged helix-turn-helix transcriptional regulator n=1 Tax=Aeromicrobium sp. CFBP 8757 TaxID=2775288 RepID=UPI0017838B33|nr:MarR family winged helix-turn-helix transcriptional regulator [Aeromicrobium sp. CFBP 8757]MBD8608362.1 winged helix-turn-helix transcriptional regulator [Aeromicrobium sp. CFBP 8757]
MSETTGERTIGPVDDFGQALGSLLRRYLDGAREATDDLPGGPRGFQVLVNASSGADCSNQATIAHRLGIDRTVMTYLVDDLEKAGLVERRPDPADRRARQVVRTAAGEATLDDVRRRMAAVEDVVLGSLSADDAVAFRRLLVAAAVGAPPTDHSMCDVVGDDLAGGC